jgi:hypothetical protein
LLKARPMAVIASAVRGMRAVYDKEGVDPGKSGLHHGYKVWLGSRRGVLILYGTWLFHQISWLTSPVICLGGCKGISCIMVTEIRIPLGAQKSSIVIRKMKKSRVICSASSLCESGLTIIRFSNTPGTCLRRDFSVPAVHHTKPLGTYSDIFRGPTHSSGIVTPSR